MHFVTRGDKVILILSLKFSPWHIPTHVTYGTMNSAWARMKILVATISMTAMYLLIDAAIDHSRQANLSGSKLFFFFVFLHLF